MNFLLFILVCYGMTQILTLGKIFDVIRPKHHFFHCTMCMGFWVGMLTFLGFWFCGIHLFTNLYLGTFFSGCISSGTSFALTSIIKDDGFNIKIG